MCISMSPNSPKPNTVVQYKHVWFDILLFLSLSKINAQIILSDISSHIYQKLVTDEHIWQYYNTVRLFLYYG